MNSTVESLDGANNPAFLLDDEAFIFEDNLFRKDWIVDKVYDWFSKVPQRVLHLFLLDQEYSDEELERIIRFRKLVSITMGKHIMVWRQRGVNDNTKTKELDLDSMWDYNFYTSGFLSKTLSTLQSKKSGDGESKSQAGYNVFNIYKICTFNVYLITIIMKGFVSKALSSCIEEAFLESTQDFRFNEKLCPIVVGEDLVRFHFSKEESWKEKFSFLKELVEPTQYTSMYDMLHGTFYEHLLEKPEFGNEFNALADQTILINFRALCRRSM